MNPKKIWANLVVADVERTRKFYTALGFRSNEGLKTTSGITSFLVGDDDFVIHFFSRDGLHPAYRDAIQTPKNANELMFTISAGSRDQVDQWAGEVQQAGGTIFHQPEDLGGGYYGFGFADPDGHRWNVFFM